SRLYLSNSAPPQLSSLTCSNSSFVKLCDTLQLPFRFQPRLLHSLRRTASSLLDIGRTQLSVRELHSDQDHPSGSAQRCLLAPDLTPAQNNQAAHYLIADHLCPKALHESRAPNELIYHLR